MSDFFDDISQIKPEYLLKATPYTKETTVNFCNQLSKEEFFSNLYSDRSDKLSFKRENDTFDKKVKYELRDLGNKFAKIAVLNISGYAGSGKTTYLHHLIWENHDKIGDYEVVDYEGKKKAIEPFVERIARKISTFGNITELCHYLDLIAKKALLDVAGFQKHLLLLSQFSHELKETDRHEFSYHVLLEKLESSPILLKEYESSTKRESHFLAFLFFLDLLLLLFNQFVHPQKSRVVLVIDNSDSLSDLSQESILIPALKQFANDCTYFFASNLTNDLDYLEQDVKEVFKNSKLVIFLTTRMATIKRYESIEPDLEKINGWTSLKLPENYYDHRDIIKKRIDFYNNKTDSLDSETLQELEMIGKLADAAYHNLKFMRLFNGNVRACVERLCSIVYEFQGIEIDEFLELNDESSYIFEATEGVNGYFLNMLLRVFKMEHIFDHKLDLSPCRKDGKISLSRIILTILRENQNRFSLYMLFTCLVPLGYSEKDICDTVWNLCEEGRKVWRRLLIFDLVVPKTLEELQHQGEQFKNGVTNIEQYSELIICTSGLAYMEFVVPHFEFMLSRHEMTKDSVGKPRYYPLFSKSSEKKLPFHQDEFVYGFEKKIDTVFEDVKDCCFNSTSFANRVMETYKLSQEEYINTTTFNYHTIGWDGEDGPKQSYESRLIFRHIGYIDRYRCYLLKKYEKIDLNICADINRRLVTRIRRYLDLYRDSEICFQTESQDKAADKLFTLIQKIKSSNYYDFSTKIRTDYDN